MGAYEEILADVTAPKSPAKYMKVKIEIFAEKEYSNFYIDNFNQKGNTIIPLSKVIRVH